MNEFLEERPTSSEPDQEKPLRILIAEDDEQVAKLLEIILSGEGNSVTVVTSAKQALEKLEEAFKNKTEYDELITDKGLKGPKNEDGFFLVSKMKAQGFGKTTYVTMLTGDEKRVSRENPGDMLVEKGIHNLVGKPFRLAELIESASKIRAWQQEQKQ